LLAGDAVVFLAAWLLPPGDPVLSLAAGLMLPVFLALLLSYLRGWPYARQATVVIVTIALAFGIQEPYLTSGDSSLVIAPLMAQILAGPVWVLASASALWGVLLVRAGGQAIYTNPVALAIWVMLVGGLIVSRLIVETSLREAQEARREAERQANHASRSEAQYRLLFESHPEPMWVYDLDTLQFLAVNEAALRQYGYSREEFLGMTIAAIRPAEDVPKLLERVAEVSASFTEPTVWRHLKKDGTPLDVEIRSFGLSFQGRLARLVMATDVTARLRATEQLRVQGAALEAAANGIVITDPAGVIRWVNPAFTRLTGYAPDEAMGQTPRLLRSGQQSPDVYRDLWTTVRSGQVWQGLLVNRRKDGSLYTEEQTITPVRDERGAISHFVAIKQDVTEREQARAALAANERRFRRLIENSTDAITLIGTDGTVVYDSPSAPGLLGYAPDEWIGRSVFELLHPQDAPSSQRLLREILAQPGARDCAIVRIRHKDGTWRWIEGVVSNLLHETSVRAIVVNYRDITQRKHNETMLRASEERFRQLAENIPEVFWLLDIAEQRVVYVSPAYEAVWGRTCQSLYDDPRSYFHAIHAEDQPQALLAFERHRLGEPSDLEYRVIGPDGTIRWVHDRASPVRDDQGQLYRIAGVAQDITERKRIEERLAYQAEVLEHVHDCIVAADAQLRVTVWNRAAQELYGWASQEVLGRNLLETIRSELTEVEQAEGLRQLAETGRFAIDTIHHRRDGTPINVAGTIVAQRDAAEQITSYLAAYRDVTEHKRAQAQIAKQVQRLQALRAIDNAITGSLDLYLILGVILSHVTSQLAVDTADVLLLDPHSLELRYAAGHGFRTHATHQARLRGSEGYVGQAVLERTLVHVPDLRQANPPFRRMSLFESEHFVSYYGAPLIAKGQVKGVLEVFHRTALTADQEWLGFLEALAGQAAIAVDNANLFDNLQRSNADLVAAYDATIEGWSRALDLRDRETEGHSQRVTELTLRLAGALGMSDTDRVHVRRGALLHDIGKMGIPDQILLKSGPLDDDEWRIMRQHPTFAYELLSPIAFLQPALDIPYCHHEKWDGTGYPRGLRAEQIPLAARIFAVVDVWDALRASRPYRPAWPAEQVLAHIRDLAGSHFDPEVAEAFQAMLVDYP
jgi:PAS domain S-box-containing protein/putative nucleotidyltransferase with HDIG domain